MFPVQLSWKLDVEKYLCSCESPLQEDEFAIQSIQANRLLPNNPQSNTLSASSESTHTTQTQPTSPHLPQHPFIMPGKTEAIAATAMVALPAAFIDPTLASAVTLVASTAVLSVMFVGKGAKKGSLFVKGKYMERKHALEQHEHEHASSSSSSSKGDEAPPPCK